MSHKSTNPMSQLLRFPLPLTTGTTKEVAFDSSSSGGHRLLCFVEPGDASPRFVIPLEGGRFVNNVTDKGPCIFLVTSAGEFEFQCTSRESCEGWNEVLTEAGVTQFKFTQLYKLTKFLGEGSFARVYLGQHLYTGEEVVVKAVDMRAAVDSNQSALAEIGILRDISHPSISRLYAAYEQDNHTCMVLEYLRGGELFDAIVKGGPVREDTARRAMKRIFSALEELHLRGIVHRDVKTENLMLENENDVASVKLIDFGLATRLGSPHMSMRCGSPGYVAPEILANHPYDCKVDVFSAGVICFILLEGRPPFLGKGLLEIVRKNLRCQISFSAPQWASVSPAAVAFIQACCSVDPAKRLSSTEALSHPWMNGAWEMPKNPFHLTLPFPPVSTVPSDLLGEGETVEGSADTAASSGEASVSAVERSDSCNDDMAPISFVGGEEEEEEQQYRVSRRDGGSGGGYPASDERSFLSPDSRPPAGGGGGGAAQPSKETAPSSSPSSSNSSLSTARALPIPPGGSPSPSPSARVSSIAALQMIGGDCEEDEDEKGMMVEGGGKRSFNGGFLDCQDLQTWSRSRINLPLAELRGELEGRVGGSSGSSGENRSRSVSPAPCGVPTVALPLSDREGDVSVAPYSSACTPPLVSDGAQPSGEVLVGSCAVEGRGDGGEFGDTEASRLLNRLHTSVPILATASVRLRRARLQKTLFGGIDPQTGVRKRTADNSQNAAHLSFLSAAEAAKTRAADMPLSFPSDERECEGGGWGDLEDSGALRRFSTLAHFWTSAHVASVPHPTACDPTAALPPQKAAASIPENQHQAPTDCGRDAGRGGDSGVESGRPPRSSSSLLISSAGESRAAAEKRGGMCEEEEGREGVTQREQQQQQQQSDAGSSTVLCKCCHSGLSQISQAPPSMCHTPETPSLTLPTSRQTSRTDDESGTVKGIAVSEVEEEEEEGGEREEEVLRHDHRRRSAPAEGPLPGGQIALIEDGPSEWAGSRLLRGDRSVGLLRRRLFGRERFLSDPSQASHAFATAVKGGLAALRRYETSPLESEGGGKTIEGGGSPLTCSVRRERSGSSVSSLSSRRTAARTELRASLVAAAVVDLSSLRSLGGRGGGEG
uniref:Protein kinase domain-containing protein n=1 Tax=Chromera velia CCMP2878 TaxID=1169474 RepID=A0A0G4EYG1_9ALVE|eukprot:Cvel_14290.t1-p1 / transcript=Cvel_14290.t1 / gene=Cvel_14290 / organism=Chromera_velia_CCMP2878 / gene_product=Probable serine/threonine-protein kinase 2, putative / transcript_product=Probable serine/threonine-protein kinase 2, putative / location=Cvel_scaffold1009:26169-31454(+) / protein_length=1110 / sequence_SO=supercontig / SO=protein_coding / is_pseudo=false